MSTTLLEGIGKAFALLREHNAVPNTIELTSDQFNRLRREVEASGILVKDDPAMCNSIYGVKIIVKDIS